MAIAEVIKFEGPQDALVWKFPIEDFNATSQLIVDETHEALLVVNGNAADLFANGNLLTYALKNGKHDLADDVLRNTNNINVSMALSEVLQKYPDGDKKGEHIADLIKTHALGHEDRAVIGLSQCFLSVV